MAEGRKGGKKNRKYGRQKLRSHAHKRYTATMRWEANKRKRVARHARRMARKAAHRAAWEAKQK